jgi:hypothetical protein
MNTPFLHSYGAHLWAVEHAGYENLNLAEGSLNSDLDRVARCQGRISRSRNLEDFPRTAQFLKGPCKPAQIRER